MILFDSIYMKSKYRQNYSVILEIRQRCTVYEGERCRAMREDKNGQWLHRGIKLSKFNKLNIKAVHFCLLIMAQ